MLLNQSLPVDTTKLENGMEYISHDITLLKDYMRAHKNALYATPQLIDVEEPKSIMVLRMRRQGKEVLMTMINPVILSVREMIAVEETQDQIEGTYLNIRHPQLHVAYLALPGAKPTEVTLSGKSALIFQQALRLMQGITIDVFGLRVDTYPEYQNGTDEERQKIIADYIKALKEVSEESLQDEDTQEYIKAADFMAENIEKSVNAEFTAHLQDAYQEVKQAEEQVAKKRRNDNID